MMHMYRNLIAAVIGFSEVSSYIKVEVYEKMTFIEWLEKDNKLNVRFEALKTRLNIYLDDFIRDEEKEDICKRFDDVLGKCDSIDYQEPGTGVAYAILHFLDRYRRFQLVFLELINKGLLPIKNEINILDIGTGPGPSIYAISDIYELYKQYEFELFNKTQINKVSIEYVERSEEFLRFLHHFTEYANYPPRMERDWNYNIPYHFALERDILDLNFNKRVKKYVEKYDDYDGGYYTVMKEITIKRRFDIVISSNFLTNIDLVKKFEKQIKDSMFFMRNKGIFVTVGAASAHKKYNEVYTTLDEYILSKKYNTKRFGGFCKKVIKNLPMAYSFSDDIGRLVIDTIIDNIYKITGSDLDNRLELNFLKKVRVWEKNRYSNTISWEINVYKRTSWPKLPLKRQKTV